MNCIVVDNGITVVMRDENHVGGDSIVRERIPMINKKVVSDSKRRIDCVDHKFWNGTDKSARTFFIPYIFRRLGWVVFP
jgi:hypothetical protein